MNVLDLFSGIGGFSLGLERAGMRTVAFCEIDPYCRAVLRRHWPGVPIHEDIRSLHAAAVPARVDLVCGGFPCQDISLAGKGAGLSGERSGLWFEYARIIEEVRPRYAIIENVSALRSRGLDVVLGSLTALGYDAEWHCIPASAVGAPHRRDRVWIVAYEQADAQRADADRIRPHRAHMHEQRGAEFRDEQIGDARPLGEALANTDAANAKREFIRQQSGRGSRKGGPGSSFIAEHGKAGHVADAAELAEREPQHETNAFAVSGQARHVSGDGRIDDANAMHTRLEGQRPLASRISAELNNARNNSGRITEPDVGRVANGIPSRVDRLKSLGNAVVPQIPEIIGRAIMKAEGLTP